MINVAENKKLSQQDAKLVMAHMYVVLVALIIGGLAGLIQTWVRSGKLVLPAGINYYSILTVHGVILALVLTTFFIMGFQLSAVSRTTGALSTKARLSGWIGFWVMLIGTVAAVVMILLNQAPVLYTMYAPLQAHPIFYMGITLVVIGSWISSGAILAAYMKWRKTNKGQVSPLLAFMSVVNTLLWIVATIGLAITLLLQILPLSLGLIDSINVLLSRTLFWYFGHPLVYFWLLPAYMCWYVVIPKVIGGKIFSDSLARMSFILFCYFQFLLGFTISY